MNSHKCRLIADIPQLAALLLAAILLISLFITGCNGGFKGESNATLQDGTQVMMTLNSDGTYNQVIVCKSGKVWQKTGTWQAVNNAPAYVDIRQQYDSRSCCSSKFNEPKMEDAVVAKSAYQSSENYSDSGSSGTAGVDRQTLIDRILLVRIILGLVWLCTVMDIICHSSLTASTKTIWFLAVTFCCIFGLAAYWFYGRWVTK
jgi:hypothetical protein